MSPALDSVDHLVEVLADSHEPGQLRAKALAYRLRRLAHWLETEIKRELAALGIELWELELLACLIRSTPDRQLSAGQLAAELQLTSGAVTNRVGRLERLGWVTRDFAPTDRRSVLVTLTEAGAQRAYDVFAAKTGIESALLSGITAARQDRLNNDLRALLLTMETLKGDGSR
ncbi:MarR family winged helix-turn-helix transcriptional regulator [Kribbella kalugense]|uniref:MarR family winged helix-turn-helix transcriptional regulator n=1 Tax=Kribbella kalugense TaxID=2512221 RepID=UPI00141709C1|nr:MarR family transcriptional regulator [Kribbella kalugense]